MSAQSIDRGEVRTRRYRSTLRRQQAADTRRRVVEAAVKLFAEQGYRATTFSQLAAEAGVSVKTVQDHGPKPALLQAAVELASFGVEGETDIFDTDVGKAILDVRAAAEFAELAGPAMLAINTPSAGVWLSAAGAAQGDEELGRFHATMLSQIRGQATRILGYLAERGWLRTDVPFDDLVEAFCVITSVETYARFILHDGKSAEEYGAFVSRAIRELVLAG